jgi:hypothetical protein
MSPKLLRLYLGGDGKNGETVLPEMPHDRCDHDAKTGKDDGLLAAVGGSAHKLTDLLELVPRLGLEYPAIEVIARDRTGGGIAKFPERARDDPHVRVAIRFAERLCDGLLRPFAVDGVETAVGGVHVEEHDLTLFRRKDEDVVLAAPNGEGRHQAPEAIEITDLGKHLPRPQTGCLRTDG